MDDYLGLMGETAIKIIRMYQTISKEYLEYCGMVIDTMIKSIEENGDKMTANTDFFNGYISGYNQHMKDLEDNEKYSPLPINRFIRFYS